MKILKHSSIVHCIEITLLLLAANSALAQDFIYRIPGISSREVIVRDWKENLSVIYSYDGFSSRFVVVDEQNVVAYDLQALSIPVSATISDFEIVEDDLYFCANSAAGPVFGKFNITNAIYGTEYMTIVPLNGLVLSNYNSSCYEKIDNLFKIAVRTYADGFHAFMIGECRFGAASTRCIVDLHYVTAGGTWKCEFTQEHSSTFYYDDVAITDNNVVVIGHKYGADSHYLTYFSNPPDANTSILFLSPIPTVQHYYSNGVGGYQPFSYRDLMITAMGNDMFAVVGYAKCDFVTYGAMLSIYNGVSNLVYRCYIQQGTVDSALWQLRDLRYDTNKNIIYLHQYMRDPVISTNMEYVLCEYMLDPTYNVIGLNTYYDPSVKNMSMDRRTSAGRALVAGFDSDLKLWTHQSHYPSSCIKNTTIPYPSNHGLDQNGIYEIYPVLLQCTALIYRIISTEVSVEIECTE